MLNGSMNHSPHKSETSNTAMIAGLGAATLILGMVIVFGVVQIKSQKQQLSQMSEMVNQLANMRNAEQDVTRTASADLITLAPASQPAPQPVTQAIAPQPAPVQPSTAALVRTAVAAGSNAQQASVPVQAAASVNSTADKSAPL